MTCAMRKSCGMIFKRFTERLSEINNFNSLFHGLDATKNMPSEELDEILLHAVPNGWSKKAYLQGWDFDMKTFRETCEMFERMEIAEQIYKGKTPLKKYLGQMPTVTVMSGREREENTTRLSTLRRAALASERQKIQSLQVRRRPVQIKHACCMAADIPRSNVNY